MPWLGHNELQASHLPVQGLSDQTDTTSGFVAVELGG